LKVHKRLREKVETFSINPYQNNSIKSLQEKRRKNPKYSLLECFKSKKR